MAVFDYLSGDHLLCDTCSWAARTGETEDANYDDTETFTEPVELACLVNQPASRWYDRWPLAELTGALELVLPHDSTLAARDRVTYAGQVYRVKDVADWAGAGLVALVERSEGVTS
jgi:hypothetical protein